MIVNQVIVNRQVMNLNRKLRIMIGMVAAVALCAAATSPRASGGPEPGAEDLRLRVALQAADSGYKNLKVLPKGVSPKMLQQIMIDDFEDGLGVGCGFCHAKQEGSERLDYASDAKPGKEIARKMMRMTLQMNKKYFQARHPQIGTPALIVTCTTCHHGQPRPDNGSGE
jgi:hypothetical protein